MAGQATKRQAAVTELAVVKALEILRLEHRLTALRKELEAVLADRVIEVEYQGERYVFGRVIEVTRRVWDMPRALSVLRKKRRDVMALVEFPDRVEKALLADPETAAVLAGCYTETRYKRFGHKKGV